MVRLVACAMLALFIVLAVPQISEARCFGGRFRQWRQNRPHRLRVFFQNHHLLRR